MIKYKVKNKLETFVRIGKILFKPNETKILDFKPTSDKFEVELLKEPIKKLILEMKEKKGETVSGVTKNKKLNRRKK